MSYNDEAFIKAMVREGRAEEVIRSTLKRGCVAGLPGASEFVCPLCGGHTFGTLIPPAGPDGRIDVANGIGYCSTWSADGKQCDFEWERSEDATVFWPEGTREGNPAWALSGIVLRG